MAAKGKSTKSNFFKGVKSELKRVNWPNRKELKSYTMVVIVVCAAVSLGIGLADSIFGRVLEFFIN